MKPREDFSLIKVILWDIDGTLLNFKMSERYAIDYCFNKFHMGTCTDEMLQRYSVINRGYWERLETGELTREQVMLGRFHEFFESEGLPTDQVKVFNDEYQIRLGDKAFFCDHGDELVKQLKATVKQEKITYILFEEDMEFEQQECREETIAAAYEKVYETQDGRIRIYKTTE